MGFPALGAVGKVSTNTKGNVL